MARDDIVEELQVRGREAVCRVKRFEKEAFTAKAWEKFTKWVHMSFPASMYGAKATEGKAFNEFVRELYRKRSRWDKNILIDLLERLGESEEEARNHVCRAEFGIDLLSDGTRG